MINCRSSLSCLSEINRWSSINCLYKAGFDVIPIGSRIDDRFIGRFSVVFDILSGFYYEITHKIACKCCFMGIFELLLLI